MAEELGASGQAGLDAWDVGLDPQAALGLCLGFPGGSGLSHGEQGPVSLPFPAAMAKQRSALASAAR